MKLSIRHAASFGMMAVAAAWAGSVWAAPYTTMTDLGGQTVSMSGGWNTIFGNGGGIKNGTLNADISGWWTMGGVTFTIGSGGKVVTKEYTDSKGEINFGGGATLIIDGGEFVYNNRRGQGGSGNGSNGFYLGDSGTAPNNFAVMRIQNGGVFTSTYQYMRVGSNDGQYGYLSVDDGTLNFPANRTFTIGYNNSISIVGLTNCTLNAQAIWICEVKNAQINLAMKDSIANIERIYQNKNPAEGSAVNFDNVTFNTRAANVDMFSNINVPYNLAATSPSTPRTMSAPRVRSPAPAS